MSYQCFVEGCPANHVSKHEVCVVSSNHQLADFLDHLGAAFARGEYPDDASHTRRLKLWDAATALRMSSPVETSRELTDDYLRQVWRDNGGEFFGPNVEHGDMVETKLLSFLRRIYTGLAAVREAERRAVEPEAEQPKDCAEVTLRVEVTSDTLHKVEEFTKFLSNVILESPSDAGADVMVTIHRDGQLSVFETNRTPVNGTPEHE